MKRFRTMVVAAALVTPLAGFPLAGIAQAPEAPASETITVEAPRSVPLPVEHSPYTGAAVAVTTVKMPVLYGDLDLATAVGEDRLMIRIDRVAQDLCKQLDRLYPFNPDPECVGKAVAHVTPAAKALIAAARE